MSSSAGASWSDVPGDVWFSIGLKLDAAADRIRFRAVSKSLASFVPFRQPPLLMLSEYDPEGERVIDWIPPDDDYYYYESPPPPLSRVEVVETEVEIAHEVEIESDNQSDGEIKIEYCNKNEDEDDSPLPARPRGFVTVGEQEIYKLDVPEAEGARAVGSTGNWLITVKADTVIRLLNPFTRIQIDLPSQSKFEYRLYHPEDIPPGNGNVVPPPLDVTVHVCTFLWKVIIYPPPSGNTTITNDFMVIAIHHPSQRLAFAKPGDEVWTTIKTEIPKERGVMDIVMYRGLLYAITSFGVLLSCDIHTHPNPPQLKVFADEFDKFRIDLYHCPNYQQLYLVECSGNLLFVVRFIESFGRSDGGRVEKIPFYKTRRFQVYQLDFTTRKWNELKSLGEYSLFLGYNTSVSVLASEYYGWVKKNCIYFTDDFSFLYYGTTTRGGHDMGVFDLNDHTIKPHYNGISSCYFSPPIWIVPT